VSREGERWIAALGVVVAAGCGPTLGARGNLVALATAYTSCEHVSRVAQLTENAFEVDGGGAMVEYTDTAAGPDRAFRLMTPAATLAAADLRCNLDGLSALGARVPTRREFSGCGMQASYGLVCLDDGGCHWEREGNATPLAMAPAPMIRPSAPPDAPDTSAIPPPPGAP
jgi:hypothetical protein